MSNRNIVAIGYTDDIRILLEAYTNSDWKDHGYTLAVSNFLSRTINYIPALMTDADFNISMGCILDTIRELILPDVYSEYNEYVIRLIIDDIADNYGYSFSDVLSESRYSEIMRLYEAAVKKNGYDMEDMYQYLFQPDLHEVVMRCRVFKMIATTILNTVSIYCKMYPILYDITSNRKMFYLIEHVDPSGFLLSYHIDPSVQ